MTRPIDLTSPTTHTAAPVQGSLRRDLAPRRRWLWSLSSALAAFALSALGACGPTGTEPIKQSAPSAVRSDVGARVPADTATRAGGGYVDPNI